MISTEHDLQIYHGEGWILFVARDLKNWWTEKLLGFVYVCEKSDTYEKLCYWKPAYCSEGYVDVVHDNQKVAIFYGRLPTRKDAVTLSQDGVCGDYPCGSLEIKQEELKW